jgi:maltokinase
VLAGEQSNTSVVFGADDAGPVICKLFRQLHAGINPDIELQTALADAGSRHVPRVIGQVDASWTDPLAEQPTEAPAEAPRPASVTGSLAFAQEFLPGVDDAWRVALRAAREGASFTGAAHALGAATADVHVRLASLLPTAPADDAARAAAAVAWQRRLDIAIAEIPELARHREAVADVYAQALQTLWQPLQRIHGDYHLGQVLQAPGRGWVLLDFEGEPMRPIAERRRPDSVLRDVAGMLRSFDYVAGSLQRAGTPAPRAWAPEARQASLGGYEGRTGLPATGPLLDAFELDKAVYEAIYESRNRPDWLAIPLAAIDRLVTRL